MIIYDNVYYGENISINWWNAFYRSEDSTNRHVTDFSLWFSHYLVHCKHLLVSNIVTFLVFSSSLKSSLAS